MADPLDEAELELDAELLVLLEVEAELELDAELLVLLEAEEGLELMEELLDFPELEPMDELLVVSEAADEVDVALVAAPELVGTALLELVPPELAPLVELSWPPAPPAVCPSPSLHDESASAGIPTARSAA